MNLINALVLIWVKCWSRLGRGCVSLRGSYVPKGIIPLPKHFIIMINVLMIIEVKHRQDWECGFSSQEAATSPKGLSLAKTFYDFIYWIGDDLGEE